MRFIKTACIAALRIFLTVWYGLVRLFVRKKDAVAFISRESDEITAEFRLLSEELAVRRPHTEQIFCCKRAAKAEMGLSYIKEIHSQLKALAKARVAVIDTYCIPVSLLTHRNLTVIQLWHAITIIKQFGWQTVGKPEGSDPVVAKAMRMHRGYDAVIAGSEQMRPILSATMHQPIEKIYALGLPLSDKILATDGKEIKERFLAKHPEAEGKTIISYVPTMRRGSAVPCSRLLDAVDPERELLFISLHPVDLLTKIDERKGVVADNDFTSQDSVFFADAVITDYSGTSAEAVLACKPILFYVPDIEQYKADCGLNIDPREHFPTLTYSSAESMLEVIRASAYDRVALEQVRRTLVGSCDGQSTRRIADMIISALDA